MNGNQNVVIVNNRLYSTYWYLILRSQPRRHLSTPPFNKFITDRSNKTYIKQFAAARPKGGALAGEGGVLEILPSRDLWTVPRSLYMLSHVRQVAHTFAANGLSFQYLEATLRSLEPRNNAYVLYPVRYLGAPLLLMRSCNRSL